MKKILFVTIAAVAGVFVKKKIDEGRNEQDLWQQATDPVDPSTGSGPRQA